MGSCKVVSGVLFCIFVPGILQMTGFFKDEWAARPNATCPVVGLQGNKCGADYTGVFVLEIIPTLVFILPVAALVLTFGGCGECDSDNDDDDDGDNDVAMWCTLLVYVLWMSSILCVLVFPFVGILILTGCIMFSTHIATTDLGPSFYLCLFAGISHILGMVYLIYNFFQKDNRVVEETTVSVPPPGAIQTVSQSVEVTEERTVAYTDDRGNFIFSREFRIIRMFE